MKLHFKVSSTDTFDDMNSGHELIRIVSAQLNDQRTIPFVKKQSFLQIPIFSERLNDGTSGCHRTVTEVASVFAAHHSERELRATHHWRHHVLWCVQCLMIKSIVLLVHCSGSPKIPMEFAMKCAAVAISDCLWRSEVRTVDGLVDFECTPWSRTRECVDAFRCAVPDPPFCACLVPSSPAPRSNTTWFTPGDLDFLEAVRAPSDNPFGPSLLLFVPLAFDSLWFRGITCHFAWAAMVHNLS